MPTEGSLAGSAASTGKKTYTSLMSHHAVLTGGEILDLPVLTFAQDGTLSEIAGLEEGGEMEREGTAFFPGYLTPFAMTGTEACGSEQQLKEMLKEKARDREVGFAQGQKTPVYNIAYSPTKGLRCSRLR